VTPLVQAMQQQRRVHVESTSDPHVLRQTAVGLTSLHAGQLRDADPGQVSERLLSEFASRSLGSDVPAYLPQHIVWFLPAHRVTSLLDGNEYLQITSRLCAITLG